MQSQIKNYEKIKKYQKLAEEGRLFCILCKQPHTPDFLFSICGEISKVWGVQFSLDEGYICPIGEKGHWVLLNDLIIIER